jgi:hypothetical protein
VLEITPDSARLVSSQINLVGAITLDGATQINGALNTTGDIHGAGQIIDAAGNSANHTH